jgi:hypothetical protein
MNIESLKQIICLNERPSYQSEKNDKMIHSRHSKSIIRFAFEGALKFEFIFLAPDQLFPSLLAIGAIRNKITDLLLRAPALGQVLVGRFFRKLHTQHNSCKLFRDSTVAIWLVANN